MIQGIGYLLVYASLIFIVSGVFGIYRFKNFYPRILITSKIDTVGSITLMFGIMLIKGFSFFSLKVFLILVLMLLLNPLSTHSVARSAFFGGYKVRKD